MYEMTCYTNIKTVLEQNDFLFFDASPADGSRKAGEIGVRYTSSVSGDTGYREAVGWRETDADGVVEVTDYYSGMIYTLLGGIVTAELLALTIASSYASK